MNNMLETTSILITGETVLFGNTFVPMMLKKYNFNCPVTYSHDKMEQRKMAQKIHELMIGPEDAQNIICMRITTKYCL